MIVRNVLITLWLLLGMVPSIYANQMPTHKSLADLTIPEGWQLIDNLKVFNQERLAHIRGTHDDYKVFDKVCFDLLAAWQSYANVTAIPELAKLQYCQQKLNVYGYAGFQPDAPHVPPEIQELYLLWSQSNALIPPIDRSKGRFRQYSHITNAALGSFAAYYAVFYDYFDYSELQRDLVERMFVGNLLYVEPKHLLDTNDSVCDADNLDVTVRGLSSGVISGNACGSAHWSLIQGELLLGLKLGNEALFSKGLESIDWLLSFFAVDGAYLPYVIGTKGDAYGNLVTVPQYLGVFTEVFATLGYDFLKHKLPSGKTVKEILDGLVNIFANPEGLKQYIESGSGNQSAINWQVSVYTARPPASKFRLKHSKLYDMDFSQLDSVTALRLASYSWIEFARQSARYVDEYRPDLAQYRRVDYIAHGINGSGVDMITAYSVLDPYMLYEANHLSHTGAPISLTQNKQGGSSFVYVPKSKRAQAYVSASQRVKPITPEEHLQALALELTGGTPEDAQSGAQFEVVEDGRQQFDIDWYLIRAGTNVNEPQLVGTDQIIITDNSAQLVLSDKHFFPSRDSRGKLQIWVLNGQTIAMIGELELDYYGISYKTQLLGNLRSGFGYGDVGIYGDILAFHIK